MSLFHFSRFSARDNAQAIMLAGAMLLAATGLSATNARASEDLIVKFDQSQLIRLPRPAAEIIIGNPSIADVAIQSGNVLVITGKGFGITNMIVLDADRNVIQDQRLMVERDVNKVVHIFRGLNRQTHNCAPQCNPSLTVGDDPEYFNRLKSTLDAKIAASERGLDGGNAGGSQ
jgi:Flp pilus assembly secretin CpaC